MPSQARGAGGAGASHQPAHSVPPAWGSHAHVGGAARAGLPVWEISRSLEGPSHRAPRLTWWVWRPPSWGKSFIPVTLYRPWGCLDQSCEPGCCRRPSAAGVGGRPGTEAVAGPLYPCSVVLRPRRPVTPGTGPTSCSGFAHALSLNPCGSWRKIIVFFILLIPRMLRPGIFPGSCRPSVSLSCLHLHCWGRVTERWHGSHCQEGCDQDRNSWECFRRLS